jgi:hypothetical protein
MSEVWASVFVGWTSFRGAPECPRRKNPKRTPEEEQIKRFKEAAKKAGVASDEKEFERAFSAVSKRKAAPTKGRGHR